MTAPTTWPDRDAYKRAVLTASTSFDDPDLQGAQFQRGKLNAPMAWSGGRAMVFRATCPNGATRAVRFLLADDQAAAVRYDALSRHTSSIPVACLVPARWMPAGVRIGAGRYPLLTMDWVDGDQLDRRLDGLARQGAAAGRELHDLAVAWRVCCRAMAEAEIGHGDIHAGNVLVAAASGSGDVQFRLVDYDNIWVPGLSVPPKEKGNPAFQHPGLTHANGGQHADALPNTLVYLALLHLASTPADWTHLKGDDRLIFDRDDLADTRREIWARLAASPDADVRALAHVTVRWLSGSQPGVYGTLDEAMADAAGPRRPATPPAATTRNVWPPPPTTAAPASARNPAFNAQPLTSGPPHAMPAGRPAARQAWPPVPPPGTHRGPAGAAQPPEPWPGLTPGARPFPTAPPVPNPPATTSGDSHVLAWIAAIIVVLVIIGLFAH